MTAATIDVVAEGRASDHLVTLFNPTRGLSRSSTV
jgi:hypothetical protein